jgi:hypothetical protein
VYADSRAEKLHLKRFIVIEATLIMLTKQGFAKAVEIGFCGTVHVHIMPEVFSALLA